MAKVVYNQLSVLCANLLISDIRHTPDDRFNAMIQLHAFSLRGVHCTKSTVCKEAALLTSSSASSSHRLITYINKMKGVYFSSKLPNLTEIRDLEVPEPGNDEILVKNVAVASNPKDWKVPEWVPDWAAVEGNDIAGTVAKVGKDVTEFKEGDRVAAFTVMMKDTKYGA